MTPEKMPEVDFGSTVIYAKNQPEYLPLPAHRTNDGQVTTCWKLSVWERLQLLVTGRLYLKILTFNNPLQPLKITVGLPEEFR